MRRARNEPGALGGDGATPAGSVTRGDGSRATRERRARIAPTLSSKQIKLSGSGSAQFRHRDSYLGPKPRDYAPCLRPAVSASGACTFVHRLFDLQMIFRCNVSRRCLPADFFRFLREDAAKLLGCFKSFVRFCESTLNCNISANTYSI